MIYKLTMERTMRIGVEFECDSEEQALHEAGARFVHAMQNPKEFLGGDVEGDYALCDEEGKDLVVWS